MLNFISTLKSKFRRDGSRTPLLADITETLQNHLEAPPWCIDHLELSADKVTICGWAVPPPRKKLKPSNSSEFEVAFCLNGKLCTDVQYPLDRPDIEKAFWFIPHAIKSGFVCSFARSELYTHGRATFSYVDKRSLKPLCFNQQIYFLDPSLDILPLPPPERRSRVHGGTSESAFRIEGFSTFVKLEKTINDLGYSWSNFSHILDWGSGCGRMTRYFAQLENAQVTGVDIDADNVNWCKTAYPNFKFEAVPLCPPTLLQRGSFDLLIGISIFTHLKEKEQFDWLAELKRIAKPKALLLMTVHSTATACRSGVSESVYDQWQRNGFFDLGGNNDLAGAIQDESYYRNTLHTHKYIRTHWSKYFKILKIIPGYIGNHQDLVVMRRR